MRIIYTIILLFSFTIAYSQNYFASVFVGASNYQGDLQDKIFTLVRSKPALGMGFNYELNDRMLLNIEFANANISGDDKFSVKNRSRNLSFNSNITEFSIGFEYVLFNLYEYKASPYFFTNIGVFKFNPYLKLDNGAKIFLSEYDTEGQGFYEGRKKYKLRQLSIPFGAGIQWALSNNTRVGVLIGMRKTFTDYIDDVSTTYVDKNILFQNRGQKAVDLAYKGNLLPNGAPYPSDGTKRGNPKNKDWYYLAGVSLRFRLKTPARHQSYTFKIHKSKTTCPSSPL